LGNASNLKDLFFRDINASIATLSEKAPLRPRPPLIEGKKAIEGEIKENFDALYNAGKRIFLGADNSNILEVRT
jgi:hypothetical protein